ncbi:MAG TPA: hypothetical protein VEU62_10775 [Bryobacterales bacterium]|nr:hypothetical protein [Bryobacterales bacterium]
MLRFHAADYGSTVAEILALADPEGTPGHRLLPLAGGACVSEPARRRLEQDPLPPVVRCGLFLYLSCLDEAHKIAQEIHSATGSYWHGLMHRQEPDFSNSAYWFRKVGRHEIFPALREAAIEIAGDRWPEVKTSAAWDPFRFLDACEEAHRRPNAQLEQTLREIQRAEWQLLFDYCAREAAGKES